MSHITTGSLIKIILIVTVLAGALTLQSEEGYSFSKYEKARYADATVINFVRPGLVFKVASAQIAQDGTISARVLVTDPKGVALDRLGVVTPGAVSISLIAATIPKGQRQYNAYTTRLETSPSMTATQAAADSGGAWTQNDIGDYTYTFKTRAPSGWDNTATHTIGVYGNRSLTEFNLPTNYASTTFNFVPGGGPVTVVRDIIRTQSCNKCHDQLAFHGGSRRGIELCILCHTPQTTDAETGNTLDFKVFIHKVHMGSGLPSVQAGSPYQIVGFNNAVSDWSGVVFPSDARRCETCHEQNTGATQATAYMKGNRAACGACHDNVNFATGQNHSDANMPQFDDNQCATCHIPQGENPFDASIKGAHTIPPEYADLPGLVINILKVNNGTAGNKPTVTFTLKDNSGNPVPANSLVGGANRLGIVLAGPTSDPGYTNFGSDVTTNGYVSEDGTKATCGTDGTCVYQFLHAIPADAKGTFSIGMEGRRGATLMQGTTKETATEYGAINKVVNFSVDGSPVTPRRTVVDIAKCNGCHTRLSMHGENRNQIVMCVLCHNPSETDQARRPLAVNPADKNAPPQSVYFSLMIHKIHYGSQLAAMGQPLVIVGYGGSHNEFSDVKFPAMSPTGGIGNVQSCDMCHVNGSEQNLPVGLHDVRTPNSLLNPTPATTAACTACHATKPELSHAVANTTQFGESCTACHGPNGDFAPDKVHAQ